MEQAAREFLRAVRGKRSQLSFSRRLGYRSNVAAKWEAGRRSPTAAEALRACRLSGIDVMAACAEFHPASAPTLHDLTDEAVAAWLRALRGTRTLTEIAETASLSRYQVSRCLSGATRPPLALFFQRLDGISGFMFAARRFCQFDCPCPKRFRASCRLHVVGGPALPPRGIWLGSGT